MKKAPLSLWAVIATVTLTAPAVAETKDMTLNDFSKIKVYAPVDLDVAVGKKQSFSMEGRTEDLAKLVIDVRDNSLIIKKKKYSGRMKTVKIAVTMADLTKFVINGSSDAKIRNVDSDSFKLAINGSGNVVFDGKGTELDVEINGSGDVVSKSFDAQQVSAEINGSGDISLAGKCDNLKVSISGSGDFSGSGLTCLKVKARISGSGDVTVYASDEIKVRTSGSSDVDVYGNPKSIENRSSGSSDFIVHGNE
ncbi:MAG: DUF2807 domain-containing protein [Alphaproteobacteria bacterium]|nr:DUF2807 domain-containing protein [Alphaproteobacteria bacterium]